MRAIASAWFICLVLNITASTNFWQKTANSNFRIPGEQKIIPSKTNLVQLDDVSFRAFQPSIPTEESGQFVLLELPVPDGSFRTFKVFERPCMEKPLARKYPMIKTYQAIAVDDPFVTAKLDYTVFGFHAMVFSGKGVYFIDPCTNINTGYYNCYYKTDYTRPAENYSVCLTPDPAPTNSSSNLLEEPDAGETNIVTDTKIRNFRLALACTIEYSAAVAGPTPTKPAVLSAMVTSVNRVNGVWEKDISVHLNLVPNNDTLIFITSDSYSNNDGGAMLGQNKTVINARIGSANYDIGHVFSTGGGGVAGLGVVCGSNKAHGVTGSSNPVGDAYDIDYVIHEMGHQFGANHTFNGNTGSCNGNRVSTVAYEPGSGTTIMAYAGICGTNDIAQHSDDYFHRASLAEMNTFLGSLSCDVETSSGNTVPTVNSYVATYNIPYKTPFEITASAADPNGDPIKYCWEEWDLGPSGSWNASNNTTAPIFRSFLPNYSGTRVFPVWDSLIKNSIKYRGEVLPEVTRDVKFRCTVRDIRNGYGTFNAPDNNLLVKSVNTGTPFTVSSFAANTTITGATTQTVTWDVAGTTASPISCSGVDIFLSLDSARTFPYLLASNTPNDGSQQVQIPDVFTANASARIKVKGNGNIFFDLNNGWIKIDPAVVAASFTTSNTSVCEGASITFTNTSTGSPDSVRWTINGGSPSTSASATTVTSTFNTAGFYTVSLIAYRSGVPSPAFDQSIEVKPVPTIAFTPAAPVICSGDSVSISANYNPGATCIWSTGSSNTTITVAPAVSTYYSVTVTNNGCSSKDSVWVKVNPSKSVNIVQSVCEGESVTVGSETFSTTGTHTVVLQTTLGCDSTIILNLTVNPVKTTNLSETICEGETATAGGQDFTTTGLHTVVLQTSLGCDSIVNLNLTVNPVKTTNLSQTICDDESVTIGSETFNTSGLHTVVLQTSLGCDSMVNLNLTVNPNETLNISQSICEGASVLVGGQFFSTDGIHTIVIPTSLGCDSTIILDLTVHPSPPKGVLMYHAESIVVNGTSGVQYNWYLDGVFHSSTLIPAILPPAQGSWSVVVVSAEGCLSEVSDPWIITGTRKNVLDVSLQIMPNPASAQFELHLQAGRTETFRLSVYDLTGQLMLLEEFRVQPGLNMKRIAVEDWSRGMYFVTLTGKDGVSTKNLIVQ